MSVENNHESKSVRLRIARGAALVALGGALMSRLPQLLPGQQESVWYQSPFMILGMIFAFIGLLILFTPPRLWAVIWYFIWSFPAKVSNTCVWWYCGPKYELSHSKIEREENAF